MLNLLKSKEWEAEQSSLAKISKTKVTYDECRKYSCKDIVDNITHIKSGSAFIVKLPKNSEFHFIGRVDTNIVPNNPKMYYETLEKRTFASFSIISNKNISRYKGRAFFVYDILPEDIVHIFPMDSCTNKYAETEQELTKFPSLWLTLKELEKMSESLGVYNQITCKIKRDGKIIKPLAIIAFDKFDSTIERIMNRFGIGCIIVQADDDAINYCKDLLLDGKLKSALKYINDVYDLDLKSAINVY